jgi:hypothetical protein
MYVKIVVKMVSKVIKDTNKKQTYLIMALCAETYCDISGFPGNATVEWCVIVVFPR